jgi:rhodanese-related sulfurtransferase
MNMFSVFGKKNYDSVSARDINEKLGKINLIDVRESYEYKGGHVPKARNVPMGDILTNPEKYLNKEEEYHIICHSGSRSSRTCSKLASMDYSVVNVTGGTMSYNLPLKR